jgi:hypothetical protein
VRALEGVTVFCWSASAFWLGLAALFKLPFALFGAALLAAASAHSSKAPAKILRRVAAMAAGFVLPLLFTGLYFYLKRGLHDLLETQFIFAPAYVRSLHQNVPFPCVVRALLHPLVFPLYGMAALGITPVLLSFREHKKVAMPVRLLVGWLGVAVVILFGHGSFLGYHFLPILAPVAVLSAGALPSLPEPVRIKRPIARMVLLGIVAVCLLLAGAGIFNTSFLLGRLWRAGGHPMCGTTSGSTFVSEPRPKTGSLSGGMCLLSICMRSASHPPDSSSFSFFRSQGEARTTNGCSSPSSSPTSPNILF